jgi:hypothetical protein
MRGAAVLVTITLLVGCATGGRPPVPGPTPKPSPTATPTPAPTPDPKPTPEVCASVESFKLDIRQVQRTIVDATPGHGLPSCDAGVGKPCLPRGTFDRVSPEGGSTACERKAAPYSAALDGKPCGGKSCASGGNCLQNGENDLQYVVCKPGGVFSISDAAGTTSSIVVTFP